MPITAHLRDPETGVGAKINGDGAVFVYQESPPPPVVGTENKRRLLNGLLGTAGLDAGTTNLRVNGLTTAIDAYVEAHADYDIHIMGVAFVIADSSVLHNRFGNVTGLTQGFDMFSVESGANTYLLKKVLTGGQLIAQSGGARAFGTGGESNEIVNWSGTSDAQFVYFDIGAILPPEGLRIGRGTQDRLVVRIRDNLSQISAAGEFTVRVFGFRKYP
ncbi:MAG: hypothetical protein HQL85_19715 [Magnetococcales bacterium]|nr:hypothetical protein [Magnetococcales bacterium]MBF0631113.1 hypothetical protein [Magnetococcales bacterium]